MKKKGDKVYIVTDPIQCDINCINRNECTGLLWHLHLGDKRWPICLFLMGEVILLDVPDR